MSGLARAREWDATVLVEAPGLPAGELSFRAFAEAVVGAPVGAGEVVARAAEALDALVERPYEARLVPRSEGTWAAAAREITGELVRLPGVEADSLEHVTAPDGVRTARVDGDAPVVVAPPVAGALAELERLGADRFQACVVAADRVEDDLWEVRVDPL